jgi:hypothetical protein
MTDRFQAIRRALKPISHFAAGLPSTRQIQRNSIVCFDHQDFFVRNGTNAIMAMVARMVKGQF